MLPAVSRADTKAPADIPEIGLGEKCKIIWQMPGPTPPPLKNNLLWVL